MLWWREAGRTSMWASCFLLTMAGVLQEPKQLSPHRTGQHKHWIHMQEAP